MNALIGCSGFVGTTLLKQGKFDHLYRSTNIHEIRGKKFDVVVCAGAPAQKWLANKNPDDDLKSIENLITNLNQITCKKFILISTVDVFSFPVDVTENSPVEENGLHAYGKNRYYLEKFISEKFENALIVRLPGLVGPGLRKNIIFDFLNNNNISSIESRSAFQFYPMVNLWLDIQTAINTDVKLIHLTAEPVTVAEVSAYGFGRNFDNELSSPVVNYNMKTCHSEIFGGTGEYQYSKKEVIQAIRAYAQSEPITLKNNKGGSS